jgi:hypothetical protein
MHMRPVNLLRAASEMVGGDKALARRLGIDETLLDRLMSGQHEWPEQVLLGTVDIILANHESKHAPPRWLAGQRTLDPNADG